MKRRVLAAVVCAVGVLAVGFVLLARRRSDEGPVDATPPPPGKARVIVRVLGQDDAPVAGAYVGVLGIEMTEHVSTPGDDEHYLTLAGVRRVANLFVPHKQFANADGVAESQIDAHLRHVMVVAISGSRIARQGPLEMPSSRILRVDVRPAEGLVAVGVVTDESGTPYAGGEMHFGWAGADTSDLARLTEWKRDEFASDGRFRIGPIESHADDGEVELLAFVPGPGMKRVSFPAWRGESGKLSIVVPRR